MNALLPDRSMSPHSATNPARDVMRLPTHDAQLLTNGGTTAQIVLQGQLYLLRITRAGKLILTK